MARKRKSCRFSWSSSWHVSPLAWSFNPMLWFWTNNPMLYSWSCANNATHPCRSLYTLWIKHNNRSYLHGFWERRERVMQWCHTHNRLKTHSYEHEPSKYIRCVVMLSILKQNIPQVYFLVIYCMFWNIGKKLVCIIFTIRCVQNKLLARKYGSTVEAV